jgi:transposase-like protein
MRILWFTLQKAAAKWTMPIRRWDLALQQLAIRSPDRINL